MTKGFALWLTGIPASGKSSVTLELVRMLQELQTPVVVLESDRMRTILTPSPTYSEEERDRFYHQLAQLGALITGSGVNVIFDATANKRAYRNEARGLIPRFVEVYLACPLKVCVDRDPKGIYARAAQSKAGNVPGAQAAYETPLSPELSLDGRISPGENASRIIEKLKLYRYI